MKPTSLFATLILLFTLATGTVYAGEPTPVNINTADIATLAQLDGIGESKAQAIIEYRESNGPFKSAEQLSDVKGIGARTLEKNAERITVK
ncbi:ComEA family DNA-binding protein [Marinobacter oulmenensis]|uniref:Competence protein ComEA n=1 Tax=Marinobacter oulmenensis TaxID=643747 RepID=A0A840ULB3_9GAMM|nr:ComEA family DNA-binding protein [Marinobacter oulmenensis]MBB5321866.1 competence protein ComEA [Marinobacter oulmenensis]